MLPRVRRKLKTPVCFVLAIFSIRYLYMYMAADEGSASLERGVDTDLWPLEKITISEKYRAHFYRFLDPSTFKIHKDAAWYPVRFMDLDWGAQSHEGLENILAEQLRDERISILPGGYFPRASSKKGPQKYIPILIPYRNRLQNLISFLSYMYRYLQMKRNNYAMVVLEQMGNDSFNRAKLFNAGLRELGVDKHSYLSTNLSDCIIFHDVDKIPENTRTPYFCFSYPLQLLRVAVSMHSKRPSEGSHLQQSAEYEYYPGFFGGVTAVNRAAIIEVNGYSNCFRGWGGEDDDFRVRMELKNIKVRDIKKMYGRYYVLDHEADQKINRRTKYLLKRKRALRRMNSDGIQQVKYELVQRIIRPLYTLYQFKL